jgi:hypothetical protein
MARGYSDPGRLLAAEVLDENVDESPHLAGDLRASRPNHVDAVLGSGIIEQQRLKGPALIPSATRKEGTLAMPRPATAHRISASPLSVRRRPCGRVEIHRWPARNLQSGSAPPVYIRQACLLRSDGVLF